MTEPEPLTNGEQPQRDTSGRFLPGNKGGPGGVNRTLAGEWRQAMTDAVTPEKMAEVMGTLVANAIGGKDWAIRILLDRGMGRPKDVEDEDDDKKRYHIHLNMDLGNLMRERMVSLSGQAPAPGLRALSACQGESDEQEAGEEDEGTAH